MYGRRRRAFSTAVGQLGAQDLGSGDQGEEDRDRGWFSG
jgi:hypothetical protein